MHIVVLGSINMDLVARTPRLPLPGETIMGSKFSALPGGKGANQAVACARLGAQTFMIGRVGGDAFGVKLRADLRAAGVDVTLVEPESNAVSGVAVIEVDDQGENSIVVVSGANGRAGEAELDRLESVLDQAGLLLLQLEIPLDTVMAAARKASEKGMVVVLDPAPVHMVPDALYGLVDILTPNESEAAALAGIAIGDQSDAARAAQALLAKGVRQVIVKMGKRGVYAADARCGEFYPAYPVRALDTVGAGDAFNGALATALLEGRPLAEAIHWGQAGGALAVTKEGAQAAMPNRQELLAMVAAFA